MSFQNKSIEFSFYNLEFDSLNKILKKHNKHRFQYNDEIEYANKLYNEMINKMINKCDKHLLYALDPKSLLVIENSVDKKYCNRKLTKLNAGIKVHSTIHDGGSGFIQAVIPRTAHLIFTSEFFIMNAPWENIG